MLLALAAWSPGPVKAPVPAVVDAVLHSGPRILTTAPHPPATVDLLAFPVLAVWLAAAVATALRRDGRVLPALFPCALLLCGAAALNPEAIEAGYLSVGLLGGAAALALASAPQTAPDTSRAGFALRVRKPSAARPRRRPLPRVAAAGTAVACAVALPGVGAAVAMPGMLGGWPVRADDPRGQGDVPDRPREVRNPLAYLSEWAAAPDVPLMTVSGPRTDLRWVALAEFTGPVWLPDSTYRPAGSVLPPAGPVPPGAVSTTVRVKVRDLPGDWVPVPGVPTRVDGIPVGHDTASGTLLSADGPVTGRSYTATGTVPDWRGWRGTGAAAASGPGFERYLRLPPGAPGEAGRDRPLGRRGRQRAPARVPDRRVPARLLHLRAGSAGRARLRRPRRAAGGAGPQGRRRHLRAVRERVRRPRPRGRAAEPGGGRVRTGERRRHPPDPYRGRGGLGRGLLRGPRVGALRPQPAKALGGAPALVAVAGRQGDAL
ncbi:DUF3488 domain-containing protein [Actinomadura madurae]|nr:DUF3488 domain-containing protein [Actinomadura madurae]MCP9980975.1 DUF3488 domain-containing protein [Actinomadura madurae]